MIRWGVSLRPRVLCVLALVALWVLPAAAAPSQTVSIGARVVKVTAGAKPRATIDRGKKAGLKVGVAGELFPMRLSEGSKSDSVDFNVRLAVGRVVELTDTTATLAFEAVAGTVEVGAYFNFDLVVSDELARSSLFRVTALGVELRPQYEDTIFVTVEQMLADPSQALRDKVLDAMIDDIKKMKATVVDYMKQRIEEGRHHGKLAGQVVDELDRAQLLDFFVFVEGFPGKYVGHRWKFPEVYFTWVINGTPSGELDRKQRAAAATIKAAKAATAGGKLDEARTSWQTVLHTIPDHKDAKDAVKKIDNILLLRRTIADDPDDTANRYKLADQLYDLGAYTLALVENDALKKRGYEPFKVDRMRAYLLAKQDKWSEAAEIFKRLVKEHPDAKYLTGWLRFSVAQARLAKAPDDPAARMELATVDTDDKAWDAALFQYRKVLESKNVTDKQREVAKLAQARISIQKELEEHLNWARDEIRKHDVTNARDRIAQSLRLVDKLGDSSRPGAIVDELADLARSSSEEELALELYTKRVALTPEDEGAYTALAFALLNFDRIDEAEVQVKKALEKKESNYAHLILAYIASARDDLGEAENQAKKAAASPKYPWPLLVLARIAASRGNWDEAINHAKRALELQDAVEIRLTHAAVFLGRQAFEGLQADPSSAHERLRLVHALARLGLVKRVGEEIAKLPADGTWRSEGWWSLASSWHLHMLLRDRLAAARNAKPAAEGRKRHLALLEALAKLRASPKDDDTRIALARLQIGEESYDEGLSTLVPLMVTPIRPEVGDLVRDARESIAMPDVLTLGWEALIRNDLESANRMADEIQKLHDRIRTVQPRITGRMLRADVLGAQGQYAKAIAQEEEAIAIAAAAGDALLVATHERRIAGIRSSTGTNDALEKALVAGRKLCDDFDDELCLYQLDLQLASLDEDEGRAASAIEHTRKAWNLADRLGRPDLARTARFQHADANLTANRYGDAEDVALKLLVDSRKEKDVDNEQYSLMVLGAVATMRGQGKLARERFAEVYELGTRTGKTGWRGVARHFEGSAWLQAEHDPARAAVALEQADELYKTFGDGWATAIRATILRQLADAHLQAGKLPAARKAAEDAYALAKRFQRPPGIASSEWILALIAIKEGKADEALAHAKEAVSAAEKTDDVQLTWNAWHARARAEALKGHDKEAGDAYEKALEQLGRALQAAGGENAREGFMSTGRVREAYMDATEHFLKLGNTKRAMEILEISRDALLTQAVDPTKIQTKDAKLRAGLDRYEQTRSRVRGLQKQLDQAMQKPTAQRSDTQVKALGERIAKTRQELNQVVLDLKVTNRQRFQALTMDPQNLLGRKDKLPTGSVLVEYFVAQDALYAFVIAAGLTQPAVVRVKVTSAELEKTVGELRTAVLAEQNKVKQRDKVETLSRKLGDWVLGPLRTHIEGASTVIILPFGPLYYVPFDALVTSPVGAPVRYAIEDYRISIQTSQTIEYLLGPTRARASGTMLAVSNPDGSLPGAQLEVNRIVKTALPDAQVLGKTATVKKFQAMAGGFRYVHLATHGILDPDPRKSFMKLSDGQLTVEMINGLQGLEQGNELVVLSACDTAVEEGNSTGEGVVSIAGAFSAAGSPALVASLWAVSDDSTAELMATFYRALEQNTGDRLEALRNAKLNVLRAVRGKDKPFAAPWHWAAFQLYGDFRAPTGTTK